MRYDIFVKDWTSSDGIEVDPIIDAGDLVKTKSRAIEIVVHLMCKFGITPQDFIDELHRVYGEKKT